MQLKMLIFIECKKNLRICSFKKNISRKVLELNESSNENPYYGFHRWLHFKECSIEQKNSIIL